MLNQVQVRNATERPLYLPCFSGHVAPDPKISLWVAYIAVGGRSYRCQVCGQSLGRAPTDFAAKLENTALSLTDCLPRHLPLVDRGYYIAQNALSALCTELGFAISAILLDVRAVS